jgi:hypothetical protein
MQPSVTPSSATPDAPDTRTRPDRAARAGRRSRSRSMRLMSRIGAGSLVILLLATAGCSDLASDDRTSLPGPPRSDTPSPAAPDEGTPSGAITADDVRAIAGRGAARITMTDLPAPPDGFNAAEVRALAERLKDIAQRGVSPRLNGLAPDAAFDFVFANQYPQTTDLARTKSREATGQYDWQWAWASLFELAPTTSAAFLKVRWQADAVPGTLDDGTAAPQLQLSLITAIEHDLPPTGGAESDIAPVVMKRTLTAQSFRPLGGPGWWPAIGVQSEPLFGGKCAPKNGSLLTPTSDPEIIHEDLRKLRQLVKSDKAVDTAAVSTASSTSEYFAKYCRD